jgi:catechol-2,3-dioxygenase
MSTGINLEIDAIDHIVLRTGQVDKMLNFYMDVLNCSLERETSPELGLTQLRAGTSLIDIVAVDSELGRMGGAATGVSGHNLDHFCLRLKSISEADIRQYLHSKGIDVGEFAERYGAEGLGLSVYLKDPDGNTVELRSQL